MGRNVLFLILVLTLGAGLAPAEQLFGPRITAPELRHDLGRVQQGTRASYVFEVKNEGTDTLIIRDIQPG